MLWFLILCWKKKHKNFLKTYSLGVENILLCFLAQSYFSVPEDVRLNCTHYIFFKLNNKRELQNIAMNHSVDIDYKDFIKIYSICTKELYHFLTIDITKDKKFIRNFDETL